MTELTIISAADVALPVEPFVGRHLIAGEWRNSASGETYDRTSPAHGVLVSRAALCLALEEAAHKHESPFAVAVYVDSQMRSAPLFGEVRFNVFGLVAPPVVLLLVAFGGMVVYSLVRRMVAERAR